MHQLLIGLRDELGALALRLAAYLGVLALVAAGAVALVRGGLGEAAIASEPAQDWVAATRPHQAFSLVMPELADKSESYEIYRHPDGSRRDVMSWDLDGRPFARIVIHRPAEPASFGPAHAEIAREAGLGAPGKAQPAGLIETKFGTAALAAFATFHGGEARRCLGFAAPFDAPPLQISGWFCAENEAPPPRLAACAIDRLTMLVSGNDPQVAAFFARAELNRGLCPSVAAAATADWLAGLGEPALRGRL